MQKAKKLIRARTISALTRYHTTPSMTNANHLKSMQSGGSHRPPARIAKGNPTGNQSVIIDSVIVGQTIHPEIKNRATARISFLGVGQRKELLPGVFKVVSLMNKIIIYKHGIFYQATSFARNCPTVCVDFR